MVVYTDAPATERLEPKEAERITAPMGSVLASMDTANVERAFTNAGLAIERKDIIRTEWRGGSARRKRT